MVSQAPSDVGGLLRPAGELDAALALQPHRGVLDARSAAHLLRRAGFGGSPDDVRRYAGMDVGDAVESLIRFPSTATLPAYADDYNPGAIQRAEAPTGMRALDIAARQKVRVDVQKAEQRSLLALQLWWTQRMLSSPAPLQEKMTFYFHGHFTTAAFGKNIGPHMLYRQNQLQRSYALGNLRELTLAISRDPAMLHYLDGIRNDAAHPNENYARELMELFTLGVDRYTERDVREAARAWSGLRVNRRTGEVAYRPRLHDAGVKTFLGRTGNFNGDDIVAIIFAQPQCARFFATSLLNFFVYNDPEPALVDGVAALLRKHDFELAPVMSAIFRSNVFYSARAYRALVKSPVEFAIGAYKTLGMTQIDRRALAAMNRMGQRLFYPPNVAGWPGGSNWLTTDTMIARQNFCRALLGSRSAGSSSWLASLPMQARAAGQAIAATVLQDDVSIVSRGQIEALLGGAGSSALSALSPENYPQRVSTAAYMAMATPAYELG